MEVFVVDNASYDDSLRMLADEFPQVVVIANPQNIGFAAANNQGIAQATGRYLVLLNPDTEIKSKALVQMMNYLDQHPSVGVVGPRLTLSDGTIQGGGAGYDPSPATLFTYAFNVHTLFPQRVRSLWLAKRNYQASEIEVDWVAGACLMIRSPIIQQVGPMDVTYFMYAEDIEWCHRIRKAGWQIICLSIATVIHHIGGSTRQKERRFIGQNIKSLDVYYRSRYSRPSVFLLHFWGTIGFFLRAAVYQFLRWFRDDETYTEPALTMWECTKSSLDCLIKSFA